MLRLILVQRLKEDLLSLKTLAVVAVTALLFAAAMALMVADFDRRQQLYDQNTRNQPDSAEMFRRPEPLSVFARGVQADVYGGKAVAGINIERAPSEAYENVLLALFPTPDIRSIVLYILSLFAMMMSFDVVTGIKERRTMALIFSNPVPRGTFLLGQCLGSLVGLVSAFVLGFLLAVTILALAGSVVLTGESGLRIAAIGGLSLLYLSVFLMLGAAVSVFSDSSPRAFIKALLVWVVLVLVAPHTLMLLSRQLAPIPSAEIVAANKNAVRNDILAPPDAFMTEWPRANAATESLDDEYAKQVAQQQRRMRDAVRISPAGSYALAVSALAGTSAEAADAYVASLRSYLSQFRRWAYVEQQQDPEAPQPVLFTAETDLGEAVSQSAPDALLLLGWLAGLGFLAFWRFRTYDVR